MSDPIRPSGTPCTLRTANPSEAELLSELAFAAKASWGYSPEQLEAWRPLLTLSAEYLATHSVWVAERSGTVVGFAATQPIGRRLRLDHLWVSPHAQRQGIGRTLFQQVVTHARENRWPQLEIESDPNAEGFYRSMGAQPTGTSAAGSDGHSRPLTLFSLDLNVSGASSQPHRDILLATLNAKYIHSAFGLRYLHANLGNLQSRASIAEFDINQKPIEIAESILAHNPRILGLGIYIWNVTPSTELIGILKRARPDLIIVLGGPEVSYEPEGQEIIALADHVIAGEADLKFAEVCRGLLGLSPEGSRTYPKFIHAELPDLARVELPYDLYSENDAAHRVIYVEASRGCPFTCEFCLSSLDIPVRQFPLDRFLAAMQRLLDRGVTQFKFVDRTFNLHLPTSRAILKFFLDRWRPGLFIHFEMVPDRLPEGLREWIAQFPPGALQFEVGIQTFNPTVESLISRRQNHTHLKANFEWLRHQSGVHVHADLIAGLPGESLESFALGFDSLVALGPQEIQVGILKRLRGTPIIRHDTEWGMVYSPKPPYEILQNRLLDFNTIAQLRRFARFWDLFANSGNFPEARAWLLGLNRDSIPPTIPSHSPTPSTTGSPFWNFWRFAQWLHTRGVKTSGIALLRQFECVFDFLTHSEQIPTETAREVLRRDYMRSGRTDLPGWLGPRERAGSSTIPHRSQLPSLPRRQSRHVAESNPTIPHPIPPAPINPSDSLPSATPEPRSRQRQRDPKASVDSPPPYPPPPNQ